KPVMCTCATASPQGVSLSVCGQPAGVAVSFSPGACSPTCQSPLTISTTTATHPGSYPITVSGSPSPSSTTTFNLVVGAPPAFAYTLTNSGTITVAQPGGTGTNTITARPEERRVRKDS